MDSNYPPGAGEELDRIHAAEAKLEQAKEDAYDDVLGDLTQALFDGDAERVIYSPGFRQPDMTVAQIVSDGGEETPTFVTLLGKLVSDAGGDELRDEAIEIICRIATRHAQWCTDHVQVRD